MDNAGNVATTPKPVDTNIVLSFSSSNTDEVTSCQTLIMLADGEGSDLDTGNIAGYAYAYFTLGCTTKYSGNNFGFISFQSPEYIAAGDTVKSTVIVGATGYTGLLDYTATTQLGDTTTFTQPGSFFTIDTTSNEIDLYDGQASVTQGDWTLYDVVTFTETGAVQRYTITLGAASSVVPSILAVVIAAIFAMLRL